MKKPTCAEEIAALRTEMEKEVEDFSRRVGNLENKRAVTFAEMYRASNGVDDRNCMLTMVQAYAPSMVVQQAPEPDNRQALAALAVSGLALIATIVLMVLMVKDLNTFNKKHDGDIEAINRVQQRLLADMADAKKPQNPLVSQIVVRLKRACWISIRAKTGETYREGTFPAGFDFADTKPATVRDGCPGGVEYFVNGQEIHPENHSYKPQESEVVDIP